MIVIASQPGRLGNLLIVYANLLAWTTEHKKTLVNPAFHKYARYFPRQGFLVRFFSGKTMYLIANIKARSIRRLRMNNKLFGVCYLDWEQKVDLDSGADALGPSRFLFIQGWQFRSVTLLEKHYKKIRETFTPRQIYLDQIQHFWQRNIPGGSLAIGIHLRRGDYRKFENGTYFYSSEQYEAIMRKIQVLFGTQQIIFVISSDESPVNLKISEDLPVVYAPGQELLDMYLLARCDYIAGPPSTYSIWASFYGQVPLYMIKDPERDFIKTDFVIQNRF